MKKILILCLSLMVLQANCEAKDYAKMHMKQMKKNQEYGISNTYFADYSSDKNAVKLDIKDPKLIKLDGYEAVSKEKMTAKFAKDKAEYEKISKYLASKKVNEYYMQAYSKDFYRVYRITERLIRANGLDFMNWRISVESTNEINAFNSQTNNITVYSGILDTLRDNDDALALSIGHELAHGLMGHAKRQAKYDARVDRAYRMMNLTAYRLAEARANKNSRDMEYEADTVGAMLAAKAGYNLNNAKETISILNTLYYADELHSTHPDNAKRLQSFEQNRKYFMEDEWARQGLYNLYKSEVLGCEKSSNRNSITIARGKTSSYAPESIPQMYLRYGYKSYVNGEFKDAIKYLCDYLKTDKSNYAVYLYISYANEYLYKQTGSNGYLKKSKEFAQYAQKLAPDNKYVKEQISAL